MTPVEASQEENESQVYKNLYQQKIIKKPKFKIGDTVRISTVKKEFRKVHDPTFMEENFIDKILETDQINYEIKDLNKKGLEGTFY